MQQLGSPALSRHQPSTRSIDRRGQRTRILGFQQASNSLFVGTTRIPIALAVEVGTARARGAESSPSLKKANPSIVDRKTMKLPASYQGAYERACRCFRL